MLEAIHGLETSVLRLLREAGDGPGTMATLFAAGIGFGAIHSLLPGHGKTVLATHHAVRDAGARRIAARIARAGLDGLLIGTMRVASAVAVVLGGWSLLERTAGGEMRAPALEATGGVVLLGLGLWMVLQALRAPPPPGTQTGGRLPALAIGLVPDPVTAVVMSYAVIIDARTLGLVTMFGIALGMALTLTASGAAGLVTRTRLDARTDRPDGRPSRRLDRALRLVGGVVLLAFGAALVWRAASAGSLP